MDNRNMLRKPLTRKGQKILSEEHENLLKKERPKLLESIQRSAAEGDRSENAEYIYGKKKLRELDYRIRYLNRLLDKAQIVFPHSNQYIQFGNYFEVTDESSNKKRWIIVGEGETGFYDGGVSWKSVMGKALLGKKLGDVVIVKRPLGEIELEITKIDPLKT